MREGLALESIMQVSALPVCSPLVEADWVSARAGSDGV